MRELSLFTGAGGGLLGTHLLGWEPCGYVEWNEYCQKVIAARIADGFLPVAPIFTDVREFVQSGAARQYRGVADVVSGGFPCQPFSVSGRKLAEKDERNMWPATRDVIREVRPKFVLLENVTGLLACGYAGVVIADLAGLGYVGRWGVVSASDTGAKHKRDRWWVVAHANGVHGEGIEPWSVDQEVRSIKASGPTGLRRRGRRLEWPPEPSVGRVAHGVAGRVGSITALGNGQVPRVVATAWNLLK